MTKWLNFCLMTVAIQIASALFSDHKESSFTHKPLHDLGKPLILTPYLDKNQLAEARKASEVHLSAFGNIASYSAYFTVNKTSNSNLFFWFFPSADNYKEDPVLLWLQGGPGASSLYGLFTENGPFYVENGKVLPRNTSWHRNHSLLYIDQPIGTGYSFTDGAFLKDQHQIAEHLYSALYQFFYLFSELQSRDFFVSGESYAGKYIPAISYAIHQQNPEAAIKINLKGLLIGNGFSDPPHQTYYGDFLYEVGLIDWNLLDHFHSLEKLVKSAIKQGNYLLAAQYWNVITSLVPVCIYNYLKDSDCFDIAAVDEWQTFIVGDEARKAIHVGSQRYSLINEEVNSSLDEDTIKSVAPLIAELLSHYRVLIYNGQLDVVVAYVLTENYLKNLNFSSAVEYRTATRKTWMVDGKLAGFVKTAGNLTEVLVRNASHMVPADQPQAAYDLISKFIKNVPLSVD